MSARWPEQRICCASPVQSHTSISNPEAVVIARRHSSGWCAQVSTKLQVRYQSDLHIHSRTLLPAAAAAAAAAGAINVATRPWRRRGRWRRGRCGGGVAAGSIAAWSMAAGLIGGVVFDVSHLWHRQVSQSVSQSASQSVSQSVSQSDSQSVIQSVSQS